MTTPDILLTAVTAALAIGWVPIFMKFREGWKHRRNPVSLAICGVIALMVYSNVLFLLYLSGQTTFDALAWAMRVFNAIALINFYISFKWARIKFDDKRSTSVEPRTASSTVPPSAKPMS